MLSVPQTNVFLLFEHYVFKGKSFFTKLLSSNEGDFLMFFTHVRI